MRRAHATPCCTPSVDASHPLTLHPRAQASVCDECAARGNGGSGGGGPRAPGGEGEGVTQSGPLHTGGEGGGGVRGGREKE